MISVFFFGLFFSFLGYTLPSVLNMTALKIRLQGNKKDFNYFTFGVLLITFFQAYISVFLTKHIAKNPALIDTLEKLGIVVLLFLSLYFFHQNKKEKKQLNVAPKKINSFFTGVVLSTLNMFAIPFFCGIIAFLTRYNLMDYNFSSTLLFISGSVFGILYILLLYGKYAYTIQKKTGSITQNINLILSCITAIFALFTFIKFVV